VEGEGKFSLGVAQRPEKGENHSGCRLTPKGSVGKLWKGKQGEHWALTCGQEQDIGGRNQLRRVGS